MSLNLDSSKRAWGCELLRVGANPPTPFICSVCVPNTGRFERVALRSETGKVRSPSGSGGPSDTGSGGGGVGAGGGAGLSRKIDGESVVVSAAATSSITTISLRRQAGTGHEVRKVTLFDFKLHFWMRLIRNEAGPRLLENRIAG